MILAAIGLFLLNIVVSVAINLILTALIVWLLNLQYVPYLSDLTYWQWFIISVVISLLTTKVDTSK